MSQEKLGDALRPYVPAGARKNPRRARTEWGPADCSRRPIFCGVAVPFFFEGAGGGAYRADGSATSPDYVNEFVTSYDGLRLAKAFVRVRPALQRRIVALVNEIAGEEGE